MFRIATTLERRGDPPIIQQRGCKIERNTANQKLIVLAHTAATGVAKTGDAANLTAYVSINGGAVTAIADTSATELSATNAKGYYAFDLAQAETDGSVLVFTAKSSTSGVEVNAIPPVVQTTPGNFSVASIDGPGGYFHANVKAIDDDPNPAQSLRIVALAEGLTEFVAGTGSTSSVVTVTEPYDSAIEASSVGNLLVWQGQAREIIGYANNGGGSAEFTVSPPYTDAPVATDTLLMILNRDTGPAPLVQGAGYVGDFTVGDTVIIPFGTAANGVPTSPVGMTATLVRDGAVTLGDTGVTLTIEYGGTPGSNYAIVSTSGASLTAEHDYALSVDDGTVGGVDVSGALLGSFSVENRPAGSGGSGADTDEIVDAVVAALTDTEITVVGAVEANGTTTIYQGDDYTNSVLGDRRLTYTVTGFSGSITSATVQWKLIPRDRYDRDGSAPAEITIAGSVTLATGTLTFKVPVTAAESGALTKATSADSPNYVVQLTLVGSGGERLTELLADATVRKRIS